MKSNFKLKSYKKFISKKLLTSRSDFSCSQRKVEAVKKIKMFELCELVNFYFFLKGENINFFKLE